ncbi:hypothetical protein VCHENC02_0560A, partial [Vibrio harveyi]
MDRIN